MNIKVEDFGFVENQKVELFSLENDNGIQIQITNYGGIVTSISTPDKDGNSSNIVLGFETLGSYLSDDYLASYPYFGCIIGRVGNRIANGAFELDNVRYELTKNRDNYQLHGGHKGFDKVVWEPELIRNGNYVGLRLKYLSKDGEEGFPGNLQVVVEYTLNKENEFGIAYFAKTDKATPVNLTQHTYFNLGKEETIKNHFLQLNSSEVMEADENILPTGNMLNVENTPFDFRKGKVVEKDIDQLENGYDHTYGLKNEDGELLKIADLKAADSGRKMEVFTTEISTQIYTGAWIPKLNIDGKKKFGAYSGIAIETQHFPDSVNQDNFPSIILRPGDKYQQKTVYKFSVES